MVYFLPYLGTADHMSQVLHQILKENRSIELNLTPRHAFGNML